jgi:hypothetical protein
VSDELQRQLDRVVQMAGKQDQIVWTVFGVFAAANALLLNTLFITGNSPGAGHRHHSSSHGRLALSTVVRDPAAVYWVA